MFASETNLHCCVVNNHGIEFYVGVESGNLLATSKEQSIAELHDVSLVYSGNLKFKMRFEWLGPRS